MAESSSSTKAVANTEEPNQDNQDEYYFYDSTLVVPPSGFINLGAICWWNSLTQTLFRLPAFNRAMLGAREHLINKNKLGHTYIAIIENLLSPTPSTLKREELSIHLLRAFASEASTRNKQVNIQGQQSPAWGLNDFLDLINVDDVSHVFNNKYERSVFCKQCHKRVSFNEDRSIFIQMYSINPMRTKKDFEDYIRNHMTHLDKYTCDICKTTYTNITRLESLCMLREVIVIVFDKIQSVERWFPDTLDFMSTSDKYLKYKLVSQIEHSGSWDVRTGGGGHYWAQVFTPTNANDTTTFISYNDTSVSSGQYSPSNTTHMIVYHLMAHE